MPRYDLVPHPYKVTSPSSSASRGSYTVALPLKVVEELDLKEEGSRINYIVSEKTALIKNSKDIEGGMYWVTDFLADLFKLWKEYDYLNGKWANGEISDEEWKNQTDKIIQSFRKMGTQAKKMRNRIEGELQIAFRGEPPSSFYAVAKGFLLSENVENEKLRNISRDVERIKSRCKKITNILGKLDEAYEEGYLGGQEYFNLSILYRRRLHELESTKEKIIQIFRKDPGML